ncbi:MAG: GGDEF domain-containing protein [Gammaproteobacteria bacterium]|nr:GGDEF domain-containing protein [Gammaproteobacteria bacterium]MDH5628706.1 GGDEF domain-containing protein [Gammaproteobacteria bacterium]
MTEKSKEEIVTLSICIAFVLAVAPFAVIRALNNEWTIAIFDAVLCITMLLLGMYIHFTKRIDIARVVFSLIILSAVMTTIYLKGRDQILWAYPALISLFYVVSPKTALKLTAAYLFILIPIVYPTMNIFQLISFSITLFITIFFCYIFAKQSLKQQDKLVSISLTDPLTNIGNRRALEYKLDEIRNIHKISDINSCLIILDIDRFKSINDTYGHQVGDNILIQLTKIISKRIRNSDGLYRYGGEEFVIVMPYTELRHAQIVAEQIRELVENNHIADLNVTISLGVAELINKESSKDWVKRADDALYKAKNSGRNICFLADHKKVG